MTTAHSVTQLGRDGLSVSEWCVAGSALGGGGKPAGVGGDGSKLLSVPMKVVEGLTESRRSGGGGILGGACRRQGKGGQDGDGGEQRGGEGAFVSAAHGTRHTAGSAGRLGDAAPEAAGGESQRSGGVQRQNAATHRAMSCQVTGLASSTVRAASSERARRRHPIILARVGDGYGAPQVHGPSRE